MSRSIRIKLNKPGIIALLKSQEVHDDLEARAERIAAAIKSNGDFIAQNPDSVVKALQKAGFRAELNKDSAGDPMIESAASGTCSRTGPTSVVATPR